jgi:methyl-accepting chemotaxis protein
MFGLTTKLMDRLSYPKKFGLLGGILSLVTFGLIFSIYLSIQEDIQFTSKEQNGLVYIKQLRNLYESLQEYHAMSYSNLVGDKYDLKQYYEKTNNNIKEMDKIDTAIGSNLKTTSKWLALKQTWAEIKAEEKPTEESIYKQDVIIEDLLGILATAADSSNLTLEPEFQAYYFVDIILKMPYLVDYTNKIRQLGIKFLNSKQLSDNEKKQIISHYVLINYGLSGLESSIGKTSETSPALKEKYGILPEKYKNELMTLNKIVDDEFLSGKTGISISDFSNKASESMASNFRFFDLVAGELDNYLSQRIIRYNNKIYVSLMMALSSLFIILLFYVGMYYSIVGTIKQILDGVSQLSKGDLTVKIKINARDEWVGVTEAINYMTDSLRELIKQARNNGTALIEKSDSLKETSSHVMSSSILLNDAALSMSSVVEKMTASIKQIASHAREAQTVALQSGELSGKGGDVILSAANEMSKIAGSVRASSDAIQKLGKESENISTIVNVIKDIADQTNLLALNAAIEAARAGEQGRGFAVVADEVRGLAGRTSKSTQEITTMIKSIQSGAKSAVSSMEVGVSQVEQGVALAKQANESIANIRESGAKVVQAVNYISEALKEQSDASNEISKNITHISSMSDKNKTSIESIEQSIDMFKKLSISLEDEINKLKLG